MLNLRPALVALLLSAVAASPLPASMNATAPAATTLSTVKLRPVRSPNVNGRNITNLMGTKDFLMHYDSDPNPGTNSVVSTVSAASAPHPIIQLENSDFIKSVQCKDTSATIVFNDKTAFQAASSDWAQHDKFVFFSHDQNCGSGFDRGARDYALVDSIKTDAKTMTITAKLEFVDYETAVGSETDVHVSLGQYQAPNQKRVSKTSQMTWNEYPTNTLSTQQFGNGYQLLQSTNLDVICAGCGTDGNLAFTGEVDFSLFHGIKKVSASMQGNIDATLALGLVARDLHGKIPIANVQLASIGLPGFEIPEIVTFGPQIDLNAAANVELSATGSMQLGTKLSWPSIDISLGLDGDDTNQASGLVPTATPNFQASGSISATLDLSLPISVGVGIDVLGGKWNKQLAIVDSPTFALTGEDGTAGSTSCSGVGLSGALENNIGANIVGVTTIGLASTTMPLFSTCLGGTPAGATPPPTTPTPAPAQVSFVSITPL